MNTNTNRKVRVTFKAEHKVNNDTGEVETTTRPPFDTTEHNLNNVKRIHGKIFKEAVYIDTNEVAATSTASVKEVIVEKIITKEVIKEVAKEMTDDDVILALAKKGKTANSIARTLDMKIQDVEEILNKNITPVMA